MSTYLEARAADQAQRAALKKQIMRSARHLSATRMSWSMPHSGVIYTGTSKGRMAEAVVGGNPCYSHRGPPIIAALREIESACRRFRMTPSAPGPGPVYGVVEEDRQYIEREIDTLRAQIARDKKKLAAIRARGKPNYAIENKLRDEQNRVGELEEMIKQLDADGNNQ